MSPLQQRDFYRRLGFPGVGAEGFWSFGGFRVQPVVFVGFRVQAESLVKSSLILPDSELAWALGSELLGVKVRV